MHRKSSKSGFVCFTRVCSGLCRSHAQGDLIRSSPSRSFPDIAGDIVGTQTYTYDPVTQTGIFHVVNAPHLISLGPTRERHVPDASRTMTGR